MDNLKVTSISLKSFGNHHFKIFISEKFQKVKKILGLPTRIWSAWKCMTTEAPKSNKIRWFFKRKWLLDHTNRFFAPFGINFPLIGLDLNFKGRVNNCCDEDGISTLADQSCQFTQVFPHQSSSLNLYLQIAFHESLSF